MIASASSGCALHHFADLLDGDSRTWPSMRLMSMPGWRRQTRRGAAPPARRRRSPVRARASAPATGEEPVSCDRLGHRRIGREHAVDQRAGHEQADQQRGQAHDRGFDDLEPIGRVQAQQRLGRGRAVADRIDAGELHVGDLHLVAAGLIEAHGRFHQVGDLAHLGGGARLVGALAPLAGHRAVHHHRHRQLLDVAAILRSRS